MSKKYLICITLGYGKTHIANALQSEGIPTPLKYKETTCSYKNPNLTKNYIWNTASISKILRDRIYIGDLVQHKYAKLNYKTKKTINIDKDSYIITENCHEPIITKELYDNVQIMLDKKSNEYNYVGRGTPHLLRGLVFCSYCSAPVTYTKNHGKHFRGICSTYKKHGKSYCNNVNIREDYLIQTVINDLRNTIKSYVKNENLETTSIIKEDNSKQIDSINSKIKENEKYLANLYKDKVNGLITEEMFTSLSLEYSNEKARLTKILNTLLENENKKVDEKEIKESINKLLELPEDNIDKNLLLKLIDKIEIDNKNKIKIFYNFKNPSE